MKISIIVPVYNVEDYLQSCIDSVIGQTYENYELLLVDDGSTDKSGAMCDQNRARYPSHIKVVHATNGGPLRARLLGMQYADGDGLVFLDSDDCLRKDALEQIVKCFGDNKCDMVLFDAEVCKEFSSVQVKHPFEQKKVFVDESKREVYKNIVLGRIPNSICLKAVRANCAIVPKHFYQYNPRYGEDLLLSVHFMTNCRKIVYLDQGLYQYRIRPNSLVNSVGLQINESVKLVHVQLDRYIDQWDMPELKPLYNARKVKGWIFNLSVLEQNRNNMVKKEFKQHLRSMAVDSYFVNAYQNMELSLLSLRERALAWCLYKRLFLLLKLLCIGIEIARKVKSGKKHVG